MHGHSRDRRSLEACEPELARQAQPSVAKLRMSGGYAGIPLGFGSRARENRRKR
jgi:hypothetical protein